jgi:hypothetical protein
VTVELGRKNVSVSGFVVLARFISFVILLSVSIPVHVSETGAGRWSLK